MIKYNPINDLFYEVCMEEYMNKPVDRVWNDQDVVAEYQRYQDKCKVSRIFDITVKDINAILKRNGML